MTGNAIAITRIGQIVTAMRGDTQLGFLHLRIAGEAAMVEALFVEAAARRCGLGRALWQAAEAAARAAGAMRMTVTVEPRAIGFYQAMGCAPAAGPGAIMEKALE